MLSDGKKKVEAFEFFRSGLLTRVQVQQAHQAVEAPKTLRDTSGVHAGLFMFIQVF